MTSLGCAPLERRFDDAGGDGVYADAGLGVFHGQGVG